MSAPLRSEWEAVAARFGVGIDQVRRDHLISHLLAAFGRAIPVQELTFFGGTALSRTHLRHARLSEDVDLMVVGSRRRVVEQMLNGVAAGLARSHGQVSWSPQLTVTDDTTASVLSVGDGTTVRVQLLASTGYPAWPTEIADIEQRYSDAPPARLQVLTADGFVASKLTAWLNRAAPRDLYDLWALSDAGFLGPSAVTTFARYGYTSRPLDPAAFDRDVDESQWERSLGHQTRLVVTAREALATVREAWMTAQRT